MDSTTYLTIEQLKTMTAISKNVDVAYLEPFVDTSEMMNVYPILGTALHSALIAEVEAGSLSGMNETLVSSYIVPCSAWYCFYESLPFIRSKVFNKGVVFQASDNSTPIDNDTFKALMQHVKDKSTFFANRLLDYLENNQTSYPLWRSENNPCGDQYIKKTNSSGFFLHF